MKRLLTLLPHPKKLFILEKNFVPEVLIVVFKQKKSLAPLIHQV
jgi:hypothetical protein